MQGLRARRNKDRQALEEKERGGKKGNEREKATAGKEASDAGERVVSKKRKLKTTKEKLKQNLKEKGIFPHLKQKSEKSD